MNFDAQVSCHLKPREKNLSIEPGDLYVYSAVYPAQRAAKPGIYPVGASKIRADSDGLCPAGAAGLSPVFQRREHPMKRVRPHRALLLSALGKNTRFAGLEMLKGVRSAVVTRVEMYANLSSSETCSRS